MKTYSAVSDDISIMVMASSEEEAVTKTANKIAEIGFEFDLDYFEDALDDAFVSDDETVSEWLVNHGVDFNENNMIIMEWNDIEQNVQVHEL